MKLISLNIELNRHPETVEKFIVSGQADVICLQEVLEEDFLNIKEKLKLEGIFQPWSYVKSPYYSDLIGQKQGVAIFAKNIINSGYVFHFGKEENLLRPFGEYMSDEKFKNNNTFLWVDISFGDKTFRFINVQLPVTNEGEVTPRQLEIIDKLLAELDSFGEFVLCGDMNAPRGKESFARLANRYRDNIPLEYKISIDPKLHRSRGDAKFMVDGLFTTPGYSAANVKLTDGVSDHLAVSAEINKS